MQGNDVLHLARDDRAAAGADDLLDPADDVEIPGRVDFADISGVKPAVAQRGARGGLVAPITGHDMVSVNHDLAGRSVAVGWLTDPDLAAEQRTSRGGQQPSLV